MIGTSIPPIDMAREAALGMSADEKIAFASELCQSVCDPKKGIALLAVSRKVNERGVLLSRVAQADDDYPHYLSITHDEKIDALSRPSRWVRIKQWANRINNSTSGDVIGALCLFGVMYLLLLFTGVMQ